MIAFWRKWFELDSPTQLIALWRLGVRFSHTRVANLSSFLPYDTCYWCQNIPACRIVLLSQVPPAGMSHVQHLYGDLSECFTCALALVTESTLRLSLVWHIWATMFDHLGQPKIPLFTIRKSSLTVTDNDVPPPLHRRGDLPVKPLNGRGYITLQPSCHSLKCYHRRPYACT